MQSHMMFLSSHTQLLIFAYLWTDEQYNQTGEGVVLSGSLLLAIKIISIKHNLFQLEFYGLVNAVKVMLSCHLTDSHFLWAGLVLYIVNQHLCTFFCQYLPTALLESANGRELP